MYLLDMFEMQVIFLEVAWFPMVRLVVSTIFIVRIGRNGPYYCSGYNNTNCWNGAARVNTYVSTFNGTSINDQGKEREKV